MEHSDRQCRKAIDKASSLTAKLNAKDRYVNSIEELLVELNSSIKRYKFSQNKTTKPSSSRWKSRGTAGILQLSDLHINQIIKTADTQGTNESNYDICCKRLKKFITDAKTFFGATNVSKVVVVNTGDVLNADKRIDQVMTNAGNRSRAMMVAVDVISQILADLAEDYEVHYVTVAGNESRKHEDVTWNDISFGNNYDTCIHWILEKTMSQKIRFKPIANSIETIIHLNGKNILLTHGHQFKVLEAGINKLIARHAKSGTIINYVICGHIHSTCCTTYYSRSAALVGCSPYANNGLLEQGRASQNIYIVTNDGIIPIPIDLQQLIDDHSYSYDKNFANSSENNPKSTQDAIINK